MTGAKETKVLSDLKNWLVHDRSMDRENIFKKLHVVSQSYIIPKFSLNSIVRMFRL